MDFFQQLQGLTYLERGHFADLTSFITFLRSYSQSKQLTFDSLSLHTLRDLLDRITRDIRAASTPIRADTATLLLVRDDLQRLLPHATEASSDDVGNELPRLAVHYLHHLTDLGISCEPPAIRVVERFPEPYSKMTWAALTIDLEDKNLHGLEPGIYFRRAKIFPIYTPLTLAHELIHYAIADVNPYALARGLEEGVADVLGTVYLGKSMYPPSVIANMLIHTRLAASRTTLANQYLWALRHLASFYSREGLDGVIRLVRGGRQAIKELETRFVASAERIPDAAQKPASGPDTVATILDYVLNRFNPDLIVSPVAKLLINHGVSPGDTVLSLAQRSDIDSTAVASALTELQEEVFLLVVSDGKVSLSDANLYKDSDMLRYAIRPMEVAR